MDGHKESPFIVLILTPLGTPYDLVGGSLGAEEWLSREMT